MVKTPDEKESRSVNPGPMFSVLPIVPRPCTYLISRGQGAEIQRAIAEAELDLRSAAAQECSMDAPVSESVEGSAANRGRTEAGRESDGIGVTGDLCGEETQQASPEEGAESRERLEPGEVP